MNNVRINTRLIAPFCLQFVFSVKKLYNMTSYNSTFYKSPIPFFSLCNQPPFNMKLNRTWLFTLHQKSCCTGVWLYILKNWKYPCIVSQEERVLFHYIGHGVPKPTANGEIWVFNKVSFSITYSIYISLLAWVEQFVFFSPCQNKKLCSDFKLQLSFIIYILYHSLFMQVSEA